MGDDQFILSLDEVGTDDIGRAGGKSANLGELSGLDVPVLPGFTTTAAAYDYYVSEAGLRESMADLLDHLDPDDVEDLQERGAKLRQLFESATMPDDLEQAIVERYRWLADETGTEDPKVAVRSSATASVTMNTLPKSRRLRSVEPAVRLAHRTVSPFSTLYSQKCSTLR